MKNYALVELHCHLDGSLYLPWAYETAKRDHLIDPTWTFEDYYYEFYRIERVTSSQEAIQCFDFPLLVLQTKENITEAVYQLARTLVKQGLIYAEIRFGTQLHTRKGLTQEDALKAAIEGVKKARVDFPSIRIGLIDCLMHAGTSANDNMKENLETVELVHKYLGDEVVGLDLAGYENTGDFMLYKPLFDLANKYHIPYTIHAGEMGEGKHILDAINLGAHRIGHGVNAIQDESYIKAEVDSQIPLEVCVSSNCGKERNYAAHPIRKLMDAGAKITINCDNMSYSRTSLLNEYRQLQAIGFTDAELYQCTHNAIEAAFCSNEVKKQLYKELEKVK